MTTAVAYADRSAVLSPCGLTCLGKTKRRAHPRHPLFVRADQPREAYP